MDYRLIFTIVVFAWLAVITYLVLDRPEPQTPSELASLDAKLFALDAKVSSLEGTLDDLGHTLDAIQTELEQPPLEPVLVAPEPPAEQTATVAPEEPPTAPAAQVAEIVPEDLQPYIDQFEIEQTGTQWASRREEQIKAVFSTDPGLEMAELRAVECRSSICKVTIYTPNWRGVSDFIIIALARLDWGPGGFVNYSLTNGSANVYFSRESRPQPERQSRT